MANTWPSIAEPMPVTHTGCGLTRLATASVARMIATAPSTGRAIMACVSGDATTGAASTSLTLGTLSMATWPLRLALRQLAAVTSARSSARRPWALR